MALLKDPLFCSVRRKMRSDVLPSCSWGTCRSLAQVSLFLKTRSTMFLSACCCISVIPTLKWSRSVISPQTPMIFVVVIMAIHVES